MAHIGFVGLGHMGLPMAINLIKAGHVVSGFDLQPAALAAFEEAGGMPAMDLTALAQGKEVIITMLQSGQQVKQVCLGEEGLYSHLSSRTLHIDCSTIDVETSRHIHQQAGNRQLLVVDAPVSGGVTGASAATLTFMVGGESNAFESAKPVLEAMGKKIFHTGPAGSGQAAKICNNMILGVSMIAVSEAFVLAEKLGLSPQNLFEVVTNSSGQCWAISQYAPVPDVLPNTPANRDYAPGFASAMMLKDLLLSQNEATQSALSTPMGALATLIYEHFNKDGFGHLDFSAIIKTLE